MFRHSIDTKTTRSNVTRGLAGGVLTLAAMVSAGAGVLALPGAAAAQSIEQISPYYATVTRDGTPLQCRLGSASYPVKTLKAGDLIRVNGRAGAWLQAEYTAGMSAFVKIDEASTIESGKALKLTKNSRLMAANADGGVNWWYLLEKELPAGTTFTVTKVVKGSDGKDTGYLVPAPKGSYGFIRGDAVRQATQAEIDAVITPAAPGTPAGTPSATPAAAPKPAPTSPTPAPFPKAPATPAENKPAVVEPTRPTDAPGTGLPDTPKTTDQPPVIVPPPTDPAAQPSATPATTPSTTPPAEPVTPPAPARPKVDVEALSTLYLNAMTRSDGDVEIGAVIGEYEKAIADMETTPDTERLRKQLATRLEALRLRSELQSALVASDQRLAALREKSRQADEVISKFEQERQFAVVGRLLASTVYDGKKLPLMYRVASADPIAPRTLAYVVPTPAITLGNLVGEMVGVAGDKKFDAQLKVNVITPTRAEVVTVPAVDLPVAPTPSSAAPTTPGAAPSTPTPEGLRTEVQIRQPEKQ